MSKKLLVFSFLALACIVVAAYFFVVKKPWSAPRSHVSQPAESQSQSSEATASTPKPLSIPKPPDDRAAKQTIDEIRRELQAVMQLNEKISQVQTSKSSQLLKIQEQAVIHQRILSNIEQLSDTQSKAMPSREALLAQEKLRVIREETLRNKKALEKIQLTSKTS